MPYWLYNRYRGRGRVFCRVTALVVVCEAEDGTNDWAYQQHQPPSTQVIVVQPGLFHAIPACGLFQAGVESAGLHEPKVQTPSIATNRSHIRIAQLERPYKVPSFAPSYSHGFTSVS